MRERELSNLMIIFQGAINLIKSAWPSTWFFSSSLSFYRECFFYDTPALVYLLAMLLACLLPALLPYSIRLPTYYTTVLKKKEPKQYTLWRNRPKYYIKYYSLLSFKRWDACAIFCHNSNSHFKIKFQNKMCKIENVSFSSQFMLCLYFINSF